MSLSVQLIDEASKELEQALTRVQNKEKFFRIWGSQVRDKTRRNARAKGGRSFWREISDSVRLAQITDHSAEVAIDHVAAAQKQYGGTIRAKNAKALTIPIADEARGKRAAEFGMKDLFLIQSKNDNSILGYNDGDDFKALFVLRKSVTQDADPFVPDAAELLRMGIEAARNSKVMGV